VARGTGVESDVYVITDTPRPAVNEDEPSSPAKPRSSCLHSTAYHNVPLDTSDRSSPPEFVVDLSFLLPHGNCVPDRPVKPPAFACKVS